MNRDGVSSHFDTETKTVGEQRQRNRTFEGDMI